MKGCLLSSSNELITDVSLNRMYLCLSGYVIYDDGCHLKKFAQNPSRRDVTETAERLSDVSIVVDKMHMKGHKDRWCKENCDVRNIEDLKEVNIDEEEIMRLTVMITIKRKSFSCYNRSSQILLIVPFLK